MRILAQVVQPLMLSMLHVRHHLLLRCFVTFEFVSDNHPWHEALFFEQFAEESLRRLRVPVSLQQDIQHVPFPIHCPPQVILLLFERHHYLIKMPFVSNVRTFTPKLIRILLPEFLTPFSNCFVSHLNSSIQHHFLNVSVAQGESVVEPDTVTDDFAGKTMPGVHGQPVANKVESGRLFYVRVKLTIPFLKRTVFLNLSCSTSQESICV